MSHERGWDTRTRNGARGIIVHLESLVGVLFFHQTRAREGSRVLGFSLFFVLSLYQCPRCISGLVLSLLYERQVSNSGHRWRSRTWARNIPASYLNLTHSTDN